MNKVFMTGYIIANTEKHQNLYNYYAPNGDKKAFLTMRLSVIKPFSKKNENGYYPTQIFKVKAYGQKAEFINQYFNQGDPINVTGYIDYDDAYEKDGVRYPEQAFIAVEEVEFPLARRGEGTSNSANKAPQKTAPQQPKAQTTIAPF